MTAAIELRQAQGPLWERIVTHPFVAATADGTLPAAAFDRWLVADHYFVVGFRRFLGGLLVAAPDEPARDVLAGGLAALTPELELFRNAARERQLDLAAEPGPDALGYTSYLLASLLDGWDVALSVLYGAERAYLDAWTAVRDGARGGAYSAWVDNWSSPAFSTYVEALGGLLGDAPATRAQHRAFGRVVRYELRFWDAVYAGDSWD